MVKIVKSGYSREEMETVCVYEKETNTWNIYSTNRKHITKLMKQYKQHVEIVESTNEGLPVAINVKIPEDIVTFRKLLTDEEKQNRRERALKNSGLVKMHSKS